MPYARNRCGIVTDDDLLQIARHQEPDEDLARARVERIKQLERLHAPLVAGLMEATKRAAMQFANQRRHP